MFHRFVTHNDQKIDYDRASWLMSQEVFQQAKEALPSALGQTPFDTAIAARMDTQLAEVSPEVELQTLWDLYCQFHAERFHKPFSPDVM